MRPKLKYTTAYNNYLESEEFIEFMEFIIKFDQKWYGTAVIL